MAIPLVLLLLVSVPLIAVPLVVLIETETPDKSLPLISSAMTVTAGVILTLMVAVVGCWTKVKLLSAPGFTVTVLPPDLLGAETEVAVIVTVPDRTLVNVSTPRLAVPVPLDLLQV